MKAGVGMRRIRLLFPVLLGFLLLLCFHAAASAQTTTVMMYMCGTDIQSDMLNDLQEMCDAKTGKDIKIVVLAGGTKSWSDSRLKNKKLNLFTISGGKWSKVTDWGSDSMGSPDTLAKFVTYCWKNCRSDRNMLILWDHGSNALDGMCFDEVHDDDGLTVAELGSCLKSLKQKLSGFHLDILGADACLMGCYEMAVTVAPYADYFVGSEELEPWLGWYYVNWLKALSEDSSISTRQLASGIVDSYEYGCKKEDPYDYHTLSAIDLGKMSALSGYVDSLAQTQVSRMKGTAMSEISRTLRSMYIFGSYDDAGSDMVDLQQFLTMCAAYDADTAASAKAVLKEAVVSSYASSYVPSASGLSIFVPMENSQYIPEYLSDYQSDALTGYAGFVSAFSTAVNSGSYVFSAGSGTSGSSGIVIAGSAGTTSSADVPQNEYGSGYGYNTSGIVIAGSAGTAQATPAVTASGSGIVIAGSVTTGQPAVTVQSTPAPAETAAPEATAAVSAAEEASGGYAFSLKLTEEDLHYLSYAELLVFQDYSDENGWDLDELGRVRDTWIDWDNGEIHAVFDGTWPTISSVYVVMYEQSRTDYGRRCIIPVMLNGTSKTYLVVEYPKDATEGTILGTSEGWSENGLPVRGVTPLQNGDVITPIYPSRTADASDTMPSIDDMTASWQVYDDEEFHIVWDGTQKVVSCELPSDVTYRLAFRLHDIFGGSTTTESISFTISEQQ